MASQNPKDRASKSPHRPSIHLEIRRPHLPLLPHRTRPRIPPPPDEAWLEPALSDPRREIRNAATTALLQSPSAFRARSLNRAKPFLSLKGKKLTLTPPSEFDPAWNADGLREKPPVKTGERAWWLRQILAAAISGTSTLLIQGTAGTGEETLRYGWNYAQLLAHGPSEDALVPSPMLHAMRTGKLCRIERGHCRGGSGV